MESTERTANRRLSRLGIADLVGILRQARRPVQGYRLGLEVNRDATEP
jgi:hypothetical protein